MTYSVAIAIPSLRSLQHPEFRKSRTNCTLGLHSSGCFRVMHTFIAVFDMKSGETALNIDCVVTHLNTIPPLSGHAGISPTTRIRTIHYKSVRRSRGRQRHSHNKYRPLIMPLRFVRQLRNNTAQSLVLFIKLGTYPLVALRLEVSSPKPRALTQLFAQ